MKTRTLCTLIFYLFLVGNAFCQIEAIPLIPDKTHGFNPKGGCGEAISNLPNFVVDCDINSLTDLVIDYQFDDCGYIDCVVGDVFLELNGILIKSKVVNDVEVEGNMTVSYLDLIEAVEFQVGQSDELCFSLKYNYKCFGGGATFGSPYFSIFEYCIPLLSPGDTYERIVHDENISEIITGNCIDDPRIALCCPTDGDINDGHTKTISIKSIVEFSEESTNTLTLQLDGSIKNENVTLKFPVTYSKKFIEKNLSKYITQYSEEIPLKPEKGVCKSVRPRYLLVSVTKETGTVAPCGEEEDIPVVEFLGYDLYQITYSPCILKTCPEEKTFFVNLFQRTSNESRSGCTGDIIADLPPGSEDFTLSYAWTGPDGFTSVNKDLIGVPYGTYTLVISDECCNNYEYTYTLCENKDYGEYYLNGDNLCRTVLCRDEGCEFEEVECVKAVICNSDQNSDKCTVDFCVDGTVVLTLDGDQSSTTEYDDLQDLCIKREYCNDVLVNTLTETPLYGTWQINEEEGYCYRMITCFDEEYNRQGLLSYEEAFNNITKFCEIDRKCNEEFVDQIVSDPIDETPWVVNANNECEREIICIDGKDGFLINGEIELLNLEYNAEFEQCVADVRCDGSTNVDGNYEAPPISLDPWDYTTDGGLICYRKVICTNDGAFTTQYANGTWIPIGDCPEDENQSLYVLQCGSEMTTIEECILDTNAARSNSDLNGSEVVIYPTVTSTYVNVFDKKDQLEEIFIYSSAGNLVKKLQGTVDRLDLTELPFGMYIITCKLKTGKINSFKIIKS